MGQCGHNCAPSGLKTAVHPGFKDGHVGVGPWAFTFGWRWRHLLRRDLLVDSIFVIGHAHVAVTIQRCAQALHVVNIGLATPHVAT